MYKSVDFTQLGGLWTYQDTLDYLQTAFGAPADAIAKALGEKFVIQGMVDDGTNVSDGWIVINGELLPFVGSPKLANIDVESIVTDEQFDDGNLKPIYTTRRAKFVSIATGTSFPYTDVKRIPYNGTIGEALKNIESIFKSIINFEAAVILSGCEVTAVTTGPNSLTIAAGVHLFNGKIVASNAYTGTWPVYLKEDGSFTTAVPGSGDYITFDPYTSQHYKNVLDRALIPVGRIILEETLSNRFDGAGVGRWEMKGYQLMSTMQSRVPVGYFFDGVTVPNITDVNHVTPGYQGGEREHQLTVDEMPEHHHTNYGTKHDTSGAGAITVGNPEAGEGAPDTGNTGGNGYHNNMQPYTVVVYAKRV